MLASSWWYILHGPVRSPSKLLPLVDYTVEGGKIVLSQSFLLKRGFCCNSTCRHCPYKGERVSAPIVILGLPLGEPTRGEPTRGDTKVKAT